MKKIIIGLLVFFPLVSHASLMGFMDGQGLWDENGVQQYTCFADNTCVGLDNKIYSKPTLLGTVIDTSTPATTVAPAILPSFTIQPTQSMPTQNPVSSPSVSPSINSPIAGNSPALSIQLDPNFTPTTLTESQRILGQWIVTNNSDKDINIYMAKATLNFATAPGWGEGLNNLTLFIDHANISIYDLRAGPNIDFGGGGLFLIGHGASNLIQVGGYVGDEKDYKMIYLNATNTLQTDIRLLDTLGNNYSASGTSLTVIP